MGTVACMRVLMRQRGAVDVDGYWKKGYTIVRGVYSPSEVEAFRAAAKQSKGPKGDLLANPLLQSFLVDGRLVEIARQILGREDILYGGDSTFTINSNSHNYHKDNTDRKDPNGPDWRGRYTVLRIGLYLQDHRRHSGGLNLREGSHNTTDESEGRNVYVRTGVGDVAVWSLRTSHAGYGTLLRFPWWIDPHPSDDGKYPKWWRPYKMATDDRMALFAALGLDDDHHARYVEYLKTRTYIVGMWRNSVYDDETLAKAADVGLRVRDVRREIEGDATVGQNQWWAPIPY